MTADLTDNSHLAVLAATAKSSESRMVVWAAIIQLILMLRLFKNYETQCTPTPFKASPHPKIRNAIVVTMHFA